MVEYTCFEFIVFFSNKISEYRSLKEYIKIVLPTEGEVCVICADRLE